MARHARDHDRAATDATAIAEIGLLRAPSVTRILKSWKIAN